MDVLEDRTWGVEAANLYFRTLTEIKYVTFQDISQFLSPTSVCWTFIYSEVNIYI